MGAWYISLQVQSKELVESLFQEPELILGDLWFKDKNKFLFQILIHECLAKTLYKHKIHWLKIQTNISSKNFLETFPPSFILFYRQRHLFGKNGTNFCTIDKPILPDKQKIMPKWQIFSKMPFRYRAICLALQVKNFLIEFYKCFINFQTWIFIKKYFYIC